MIWKIQDVVESLLTQGSSLTRTSQDPPVHCHDDWAWSQEHISLGHAVAIPSTAVTYSAADANLEAVAGFEDICVSAIKDDPLSQQRSTSLPYQ